MSSGYELPSEWPMWAHDVKNTGRSDLKGSILNPAVKWKYYVGGQAQVIPLKDFPKKDDKGMILLYGGKVFARDAKGGLIWESPLIGAGELIEVRDLDEDGRKEAIIAAGNRILILSALNGKVLWSYAFPHPSGISRYIVKVGPLESYGPCLIVWPVGMGSPGRGYAFSFKDGIKDAKPLWGTPEAPETQAFTPELILSDVDLDGNNEVVIATYNKVYVFSGADGSVKAVCHNLETNPSYKNGRNYGCLVAADYDGNGYPEIFLLAHSLNQHIGVIENGKDGLSKVYTWDKFFQYSYPEDTKEVRIVPNSVQDVDGDGKMEIVVSLFNENGDERWHLVTIDPANGKYKYDLLDLFLHGIMDINGDGHPEIIASQQVKRELEPFSNLTAYEIRDGKPRQVWEVERARIILQPRMEYDLSVSDMGNSPGVFFGDIDNDGLEEFFLYLDEDGDHKPDRIAAYGGKTLVKKWEHRLPQNQGITLLHVDDLDNDGEAELLTSEKDGYVRILGKDFSGKVAIRTGGFLCCPIATSLDKKGSIRTIIPTSSKEIKVLKTRPGSKPKALWSHPGYGIHSRYYMLGGFPPVVVDLDGDGEKEVIIAGDSDGTAPRLIVLDADGREKISFPLKGRAYDWGVGRFQKKDELSVYVATERPRCPNVNDTFIFSGKGDAKPLWTKPTGPCSGLAAIYDADGDGLDDLIMASYFEFHILDGLTGEELIPVEMMRCGNAGTGHHTPIVEDVDNDGVMEILLVAGWGTLRLVDIKRGNKGNLFSTTRWVQEFTADLKLYGRIVTHEISGRMASIADVDGDGVLEVGVGTASGTVICYDAATGRVKWTYDLETVPSHIVTADIDGCGKHEFIFGARDGKLYALKGDENLKDRILWTYNFGYEVGTATIADIDGDGEAEILVSVSDGYVYAIDNTS